jgi:hypothetical protein
MENKGETTLYWESVRQHTMFIVFHAQERIPHPQGDGSYPVHTARRAYGPYQSIALSDFILSAIRDGEGIGVATKMDDRWTTVIDGYRWDYFHIVSPADGVSAEDLEMWSDNPGPPPEGMQD